MMLYGFIGLGELGWNLANSLIKAGFDVSVNDKDEDKAQSLQGQNAYDLGSQHRKCIDGVLGSLAISFDGCAKEGLIWNCFNGG